MKCLLFSVLILITLKSVIPIFCYWNTGCLYKYLASRTPYSAVRGDIRDTRIKIKECEPISIWGFFRHGKKYSDNYYANRMKTVLFLRDYVESSYVNGRSSLCAQDVENLINEPINNDMFVLHENLTDEGHQDMVGIGRRLRQAFPEIFNDLKDEDIILRFTNGTWIENSVKAFVKGLGNDDVNIDPPIEIDDKLISPYISCEKYIQEVQGNPQTFIEENKYVMGSEYLAAKDRIERRTGINITLTNAQVQALYDICRYTWSGINNRPSPWCAIFTTEDLKIFEYQEDLRLYYENGYGHPMTEKLGFPLAGNLFKSFNDVIQGRGKKLVANFGRNKIMHMFYTTLGLFKDDELLTSTKRDPGRRWRSSRTAGFSANFVAVLNRCKTNNSTDYTVVFYQNEEPLGSICRKGVCSWQEFEDKLSSFVNITLDFCKVDPHK